MPSPSTTLNCTITEAPAETAKARTQQRTPRAAVIAWAYTHYWCGVRWDFLRGSGSLLRNTRKTECGAELFLVPLKVRAAPLALLRTRVAKVTPLSVLLVVAGLWRRLRWRSLGSRVLLRRARRIAVLPRRIALPLIGRGTILRTVLLLLLRGRSVLILLLRILLLRSVLRLRSRIAVRVRAIRIGIGGIITTAVVWISVGVRITVIAAIVGITEAKSESEAAPSTVAVAATVSVATAIAAIAATIPSAVAATIASSAVAATVSACAPTETSGAPTETSGATPEATAGRATPEATTGRATPE